MYIIFSGSVELKIIAFNQCILQPYSTFTICERSQICEMKGNKHFKASYLPSIDMYCNILLLYMNAFVHLFFLFLFYFYAPNPNLEKNEEVYLFRPDCPFVRAYIDVCFHLKMSITQDL